MGVQGPPVLTLGPAPNFPHADRLEEIDCLISVHPKIDNGAELIPPFWALCEGGNHAAARPGVPPRIPPGLFTYHSLENIIRMSTIVERVTKVVVEQLGVNEDQVTMDASFVDDLGADSLDTVELVMALEEEFDTEIPDDKAETIVKVKDVIDYIEKNVSV